MQTPLQPGTAPIARDQGLQKWWQLTRPHTLTAAFAPVLLGTALAIEVTDINMLLFLAMLIASLLIQAATNMFNEYYDYKRGLDTEDSIGIGGAIVRNGIKPGTVLGLALGLYGISILIGIYICMNTSWWLAAVGLVSMLIGYLYTGGPWPIAYTPFGELFAGFFMGMLIILIAFYIQTGTVTATSVIVALPSFILVGAILLANNIRDFDGDKEFGRKTLAILVGKKNAVKLLAGMFIVSYLWILVLILAGTLTPWLALAALSLPKAKAAIEGFRLGSNPLEMMPAMKATAQTNTIFALLLSIGLFISYL
ncbi:1,4-dihydroxy-2-naphthoate octaprenyltransferase [Mesobacillus campisalis]|uniref:1,4-dihydroxy-2-naphthoate octaprenyltransferase n=1 Tax=Mesobacillus campisalis TaxID=1408103 RepID=A0A0M2ST84_9BACI|nr:1,4-dihydroxy-2-naphthoate polyprenyltransferase [Mesobacillus campisalis]KKK36207.1 1,4-dihydroxy-2-naphthoate octaprenyltransferase [Mesobacillus campisalis]